MPASLFGSSLLVTFLAISTGAQVISSASPSSTVKAPDSVVLSGGAEWTAGSTKESGNLTLEVSTNGSTRETWLFPSIHRGIAQTSFIEGRSCEITEADGKVKVSTDAACYRPVAWFAPWMAAKTVSDALTEEVDQTGDIERNAGRRKSHYSLVYPSVANKTSGIAAGLKDLMRNSAVSVTYDMATSLPVRMDFSDAIDSDPRHAVNIYVLFSEYRDEHGFMLPHHIERYVERTLQVDFHVDSITIR